MKEHRQISTEELAGRIDHTLLQAAATREQIEQTCRQAKDYAFHTVCVNGRWIALAAELLAGSKVAVGGVVSLPLGADSTKVKVVQTREAIFDGADEIDMVADLAAIIEGDSRYLLGQLQAVLKVCKSMRPPVVSRPGRTSKSSCWSGSGVFVLGQIHGNSRVTDASRGGQFSGNWKANSPGPQR